MKEKAMKIKEEEITQETIHKKFQKTEHRPLV